MVDGKFRFIDFSVRKEMPYWETDTAKFKFHTFRTTGVLSGLTGNEAFFFATHFCRVWTRDVEARPQIEELFDTYITKKELEGVQ
jgi:hypothetical protein